LRPSTGIRGPGDSAVPPGRATSDVNNCPTVRKRGTQRAVSEVRRFHSSCNFALCRQTGAVETHQTSRFRRDLPGGWRRCGRRLGPEDRVTPVDRPGPGTGRGGGRWSSAVDCESVGSGSDFAGPPRGTWAAQVASSVPPTTPCGWERNRGSDGGPGGVVGSGRPSRRGRSRRQQSVLSKQSGASALLDRRTRR